MNSGIKTMLVILLIVAVFAGMVYLKHYMSTPEYLSTHHLHNADIPALQASLKADSHYLVKQVAYKDSAILLAIDNPDKTGTDTYFNGKYALNSYTNINMVYVFQYDSAKSIDTMSTDEAIMGTGKRLGKFQEQWVAAYIDSADKSCKPLKKYLQAKMKFPDSFKNEETSYQPESVHRMRVVCKYSFGNDKGKTEERDVNAVIAADGTVVSVQ